MNLLSTGCTKCGVWQVTLELLRHDDSVTTWPEWCLFTYNYCYVYFLTHFVDVSGMSFPFLEYLHIMLILSL